MVSFFFFADGLSRSFIRDYLGGYTRLSRWDIRDYLGLRAFVRADPTPPIYLIGILVCNFCADCAATGIKRCIKRAEIRTKCHK